MNSTPEELRRRIAEVTADLGDVSADAVTAALMVAVEAVSTAAVALAEEQGDDEQVVLTEDAKAEAVLNAAGATGSLLVLIVLITHRLERLAEALPFSPARRQACAALNGLNTCLPTEVEAFARWLSEVSGQGARS